MSYFKGKKKDGEDPWYHGDFSKQNGMAPTDKFLYFFRCDECSVTWRSKSPRAECFSCEQELANL